MDQKIQHLNIVKMPFLIKLMYGFNKRPMKVPEIGKLILKFKCKCKRCRLANNWGTLLQAEVLHVIFQAGPWVITRDRDQDWKMPQWEATRPGGHISSPSTQMPPWKGKRSRENPGENPKRWNSNPNRLFKTESHQKATFIWQIKCLPLSLGMTRSRGDQLYKIGQLAVGRARPSPLLCPQRQWLPCAE